MRKIRLTLLGSIASMFVILSCQKNLQKEFPAPAAFDNPQSVQQTNIWGNPSAYHVVLESHTQVGGNWVWIWSVQNSNPGNGQNGTYQNLSHWGMQFGDCVNFSSITEAAYSADGITWTNFTPVCQPDPSQSCMIDPVLKFDFGTTGSNKSYYKVVTNQDYLVGVATGFYKSGNATGCAVINFMGISCGEPDIR